MKVAPPCHHETQRLDPGSVLIGFLSPLSSPWSTDAIAGAGVTAFAMDAVLQISRAHGRARLHR